VCGNNKYRNGGIGEAYRNVWSMKIMKAAEIEIWQWPMASVSMK